MLFTLPVSNPSNLGAPVGMAETNLSYLEPGPQGRVLYGVAQASRQIRVYNLNLTSGAPTLANTINLAGVRRVLMTPDLRYLLALTNGPDLVVVFPINQTTLDLGAPIGGFAAGSTPNNMVVDPTSGLLYISSTGDNSVVAYAINRVTGVLTPVSGSPFATGQTGLSDLMVMP